MAKSLNRYREDKYMSVQEFVSFLGISVQTFYSIKRGKRPRLTTMRRIAEKLNVSPTDISEFVLPPEDEP
jgi:transcriptional regulator with XRE-family HTH domain